MATKPPVLKLTTADPRFSPREPVTINGYRFVPDPAETIQPHEFGELAAKLEDMGPAQREQYRAREAATRSKPILNGDAAEIARRAGAMREAVAKEPSLHELERMRPGQRYVAPPRAGFATGYALNPCRVRQEGDEYVCSAHGCGRRWAVDEEKPYCANDPVWRD